MHASTDGSNVWTLMPPLTSPLGHKRATVMVIDDDADLRLALADLLAEAGYEAVCLSSCNAALSHLCQHPPPAVVVVDILMPGMNAWELVAQMRRRSFLAEIPVIAMTGRPLRLGSPVSEAMTLAKPIDPAQLLGLIEAVVRPRSPVLEPRPGDGRSSSSGTAQ
jgi:CheY-like chemotaxis protein